MTHEEQCKKTGEGPCCPDLMCPCDYQELATLKQRLAEAEEVLSFYCAYELENAKYGMRISEPLALEFYHNGKAARDYFKRKENAGAFQEVNDKVKNKHARAFKKLSEADKQEEEFETFVVPVEGVYNVDGNYLLNRSKVGDIIKFKKRVVRIAK